MFDDLTPEQVHMVKHAWGWDSREPGYRTHYCTSLDDADMLKLVKLGYFVGPQHVGNMHEGYAMYYLSDETIARLRNTPR